MKLFGQSFGAAMVAATLVAGPAAAQVKYDVGVTDTEIRIGNVMVYSGIFGPNGKMLGGTMAAYFNKINAEGGINGRKIKFISYDHGYDPAKTMAPVRKLVEEDKVLLVFAPFGSQPNAVIRDYLNEKKVPQLFALSGATRWDDPTHFPWTMGWQPNYQAEGRIYAQYLLENHPNGKIGVLYQDDAFGKDYLKGLEDGLAGKIPIVGKEPFTPIKDANVTPHLKRLKESGADILFTFSLGKAVLDSVKKKGELGWDPTHIISSVSFIKPVGVKGGEGLLSAAFLKHPADPAWRNDAAFKEWSAFMDEYFPEGDKNDARAIVAYTIAQTLVQVLEQCGDDLTRANVMKQAASLKNFRLGMALPGVVLNTSARDFAPIEQMRMWKFTGSDWELFGPVRSGVDPGAISEGFKAIFRYGGEDHRETREASNANTVTMMTGTFGATYVQIGADLASLLDDGSDFRLLPVVGRGSVQAIADILFLKGVDMGIVRTDTLDYLESKGFAANIRQQVAYISKLYNEEMHVIAPKSVQTLKDLDGRTIAVDLPDSGTFVTAITVFERLGLKPHFLYIEPRVAMEMLRNGEIDAVMSVGGKPLDLVEQIRDENLHLVGVDFAEPLQKDYLPASLSSEDYPNLIAEGRQVDTIAVPAVLATYNWTAGSERHRRVTKFVDRFFARINELKQPPFHPKWAETTPQVPLKGWIRFEPAQEWVDKNPLDTESLRQVLGAIGGREGFAEFGKDGPAGSEDDLRSAFLKFLDDRATGPRVKTLSAQDRQLLFEEFQRWRRERQSAR